MVVNIRTLAASKKVVRQLKWADYAWLEGSWLVGSIDSHAYGTGRGNLVLAVRDGEYRIAEVRYDVYTGLDRIVLV